MSSNTTKDPNAIRLQRATIEDLDLIAKLATANNLDSVDAQRHITDFYLILNQGSQPLGAVGFQIVGQHGRLHSEIYETGNRSKSISEQTWLAIKKIVKIQDLSGLWVQDDSEKWRDRGFETASSESHKIRPAAFPLNDLPWSYFELRTKSPDAISIEQHLETFQFHQKQESQRILKQAGCFKVAAYLLLIVAIVFSGFFLMLLFKELNPEIKNFLGVR